MWKNNNNSNNQNNCYSAVIMALS